MTRTYTINGIETPSVTSLLPKKDWSFMTKYRVKSVLTDYYLDSKYLNKKPSQIIEEIIGNIELLEDKDLIVGESVHGFIEQHHKSTMLPDIKSIEEKNAFDSYILFTKEHEVMPVINEETIWHKSKDGKILYAGKLDAVLKINGKHYLIDFKTGQASKTLKGFGAIPVYAENKIQICAYNQAYKSWLKEDAGYYDISQKTGKNVISWVSHLTGNKPKLDDIALLYLAKNTVSYRLVILSKEEVKKYTKIFNLYEKAYSLQKVF